MGEGAYINLMESSAIENNLGATDSERTSWENNANALAKLIEKASLQESDTYIGFEYSIPVGGRIDCIFFGKGYDGHANAVHIELKQWSNENVHEHFRGYDLRVEGYGGGAERFQAHPCHQAESYHDHLLNYIDILSDRAETKEGKIRLFGMAYCYNYSPEEDSALLNDFYSDAMKVCPLYCKGQEDELAEKLRSLLSAGGGDQIFNEIINAVPRQTKRLHDAVRGMFDGNKEFNLIGEQLNAYQAILGAIREGDKNKKTIIIVKGGPGTGKSVIAMRLVSALCDDKNYQNVYYVTRSKSLRNGFISKLKEPGRDPGSFIYSPIKFRPYYFNYKESAVDAIVVDEAHRTQKNSGDQSDRSKEVQTCLSQLMAMMYCSRVGVYFIDDNQRVKSSEIGNSAWIRVAAENYHAFIKRDIDEARKEYATLPEEIDRARKKLKEAIASQDEKAIKSHEKALKNLEGRYEWIPQWIGGVESNLNEDTRIEVLEYELKDQFRCNGSDNYLEWVDDVLSGFPAGKHLDRKQYEFGVFDTPQDLYAKIVELDDYGRYVAELKKTREFRSSKELKDAIDEAVNGERLKLKQTARVAAGYCWGWSDTLEENGDLKKDVSIPEYNFYMPWETKEKRARGDYEYKYATSADTWSLEPEGINQIGCLFSMQGWEIDYIGVIMAQDVEYDKEHDCLRYNSAETRGIGARNGEEYVRNIYRVLMTRGQKGCYVFARNEEVRNYLRRRLLEG